MKKGLVIVVTVAITFGLVGCDNRSHSETEQTSKIGSGGTGLTYGTPKSNIWD